MRECRGGRGLGRWNCARHSYCQCNYYYYYCDYDKYHYFYDYYF